MLKWFLIYLVIMNVLAFLLMGIDKRRAVRRGRRIPEKVLFAFAILGGSFGGICGMLVFRHKTKHLSFKIGFPVILIVELVLIGLILYKNAF